MGTIDSHHILVVAMENIDTVYEMDRGIAFLTQNAAVFFNQLCSADGIRLSAVLIRTGHYHKGNVRVGSAELSQSQQMGLLQIVCRFCIMVVIKDQKGHIQGTDIVDHRRLCPASTRKAKVEIIKVQLPGENVLICIAGTAGASALGDGRAVKHDRFFVLVSP